MRLPLLPILCATLAVATVPALLQAQAAPSTAGDRAALHQSPEWQTIAPHLPDLQTAAPAQLELAGDVLRARRFPEDAIAYYQAALTRGGNQVELLNRMGVARLEMQQADAAHKTFAQVVKIDRKDGQAWNNLGASSYTLRDYKEAISDYRHASKLEPQSAVVHSNLAMAYFQSQDIDSAQKQLQRALALDPQLMSEHYLGGSSVQIAGVTDYASFCFQIARVYAQRGEVQQAVLWLGKASEAGEDIRSDIRDDAHLAPYLKLAQVQTYIHEQQERRKSAVALAKPMAAGAQPTNYD
jgi:tetratricopeptide (TPR) repeat protein